MNPPVFRSVMPSLPVSDIDRAVAFYRDTLGFSLDFRNGSNFAIVARDGVQLGLVAVGVSNVPAGLGRCYCKLSSGIDSLYSDYRSRNVSVLHELRDESYGMREFMIADLDRNEINFGQVIPQD